jgi:hypothetical protein
VQWAVKRQLEFRQTLKRESAREKEISVLTPNTNVSQTRVHANVNTSHTHTHKHTHTHTYTHKVYA